MTDNLLLEQWSEKIADMILCLKIYGYLSEQDWLPMIAPKAHIEGT